MEKNKRDEAFKKNVSITIESWPKTSKDEVIFPKHEIEISGMENVSDDIVKAIKKAVVEKAAKPSWDKLGLYRADEHSVDVQKCSGRGFGNNIWGHDLIPGEELSYLGNAKIEVNVLCKNPEQEFLPNGDSYNDLKNYSWDDFDRLREAALDEDRFVEAVNSLSQGDGEQTR